MSKPKRPRKKPVKVAEAVPDPKIRMLDLTAPIEIP